MASQHPQGAVTRVPAFLNGVIMRLTLRATMGRRRALLFAVPAIIMMGLSAILKATAHSPVWRPEFIGDFGFSVVLPLTALIIGVSVVGAEIDDSSILHLLATPVSRTTIVLSKYLVAVGLTFVFAAIPEYLAGAIASGFGSKLAVGMLAGAAVGCFAYNAFFVMLSIVTRRAVPVGLLYLLIWEGLLANLVPGVRFLSAGQYSVGVANSIIHNSALNAHLTLGTSLSLAVVATVALLALSCWRLSAFSIKGELA
jgi:ABC-2 type transport system permease protein